jgi:hypothetical protein|nr:MAG TPA: hypothetical protein [Caudoviricetes sp.]
MNKLDKAIQEKDRRKPEQVQTYYKKSTPPLAKVRKNGNLW